ncbi:MAG TPA: MFS transporter, partial [Campylobacterales bacterium]|nr:MFS transporter [Campylobacterales bacterium]
FLNSMTDLGHKIILQNTILKAYEGSELIILTAIVNALILLPFILLFLPAGYLSDKYPKAKIVQYASLLAVGITSLILLAYVMGWFWVAFALTFLLAAQSAIYGPAKYGLIKEMVGKKRLTAANSMVQSVTIVAILAGGIVYSIFFEALYVEGLKDSGEILQHSYPLGFALIIASVVEFLFAMGLTKRVNSQKCSFKHLKKDFSLRELSSQVKSLTHSSEVWLSIIGLSLFWGIAQLVGAVFGAHLKSTLGIENTVVINGLLALIGVGIIVGAWLVSRMSKRFVELGFIALGAFGVGVSLLLIPMLESLVAIGFTLFLYGLFAGFFIVPLNTLIQLVTPKQRMGKVLAGNNFMQYLFMFGFLVVTTLFAYLGLDSTSLFYVVATIALVGFLFTLKHLVHEMIQLLLRFAFGLFYHVDVAGVENFKRQKGVLLLGNHLSFLDWAFIQIAISRPIRFVIDRHFYNLWYFKPFLKFFGAIPISSRGGKHALKSVEEALNNGDVVVLFPEGTLSRNGQFSKFQKGFEIPAANAQDAVIIPFYLRGLWEGKFSHAEDKIKAKSLKDIAVDFGKPMPITSSAVEVKEAVMKLSTHSWCRYIERAKSIPKTWIEEAKKVGSKLSIADSTGVELSGYKFMTAVLLMRKKFKTLFGDEQNIGLIVPTSAGGSIANMATLTLGRTIVNLNYSSGTASLKHAIEL